MDDLYDKLYQKYGTWSAVASALGITQRALLYRRKGRKDGRRKGDVIDARERIMLEMALNGKGVHVCARTDIT
jgi:hypothetical protein